MSNKFKLGLATLSGVVFGAALGIPALADRSSGTASIPYMEVQTFTRIMNKVKQHYVEEVKDDKLMENAIRGMLGNLDPHSAFLDRDDFEDMNVSTSGKFGGLGIEVTMQDGFVKVVSPIDDTPAERAGMEAGDLIIRLDDKTVKGMTLSDAVKVMRGEVGEPIVLTVVREGKDAPFTVKIIRDVIRIRSVKQRMLEEGFGYLRITQFQTSTAKGLYDGMAKMEKENGGPLKGLVLDLRNNPGGVLDGATLVSDAFLEAGNIVSTRGRTPGAKRSYNATPGDVLNGAPIVVLVNSGSASASEIVAGALQDHKRAVIVGSQTFGKGSVQSIIPIASDMAIKLTTARYYTPSGRSIQQNGIKPDIELAAYKVTKAETGFKPIKERDLTGSLSNDQDKKRAVKDGEKGAKEEKDDRPLAEKDFALFEALNLLKGITIAQQLK